MTEKFKKLKEKGLVLIKKTQSLLGENWVFVLFYFICSYISIEFLNNNIYRTNIFGEGISFGETIFRLFDVMGYLFFPIKLCCSLLMYILTFGILNFVLKNIKNSCFIIGIISQLFAIINYIVIDVRGNAISLLDLYSIGTGFSVIKGISVNIDLFFIISILIFVSSNIFLFKKKLQEEKERKFSKNEKVVLTIATIVSVIVINYGVSKVKLWDFNLAYRNNGAGLTIVKMLKQGISVKEPDEYDEEIAEEVLDNHVGSGEFIEEKSPNILVIMSESFADLDSIYELGIENESMPFYRELMKRENVVSGTLHASGFANGTANSEYEFLTQNTIAFLPAGATPYQQYILENVEESIVANLKFLGYTSYGIHSWYDSGYSRDKIYDYLQFDNKYFEDDMPGLEYIYGQYPSDESTYSLWYDIMNNKPSGEKNFSFIVTMQNHLPYTHIAESGEMYYAENHELNTYLQGLKLSDDALKELITFIDNYDEDTVLLFFGDHQPNVKQEEYALKEGIESGESKYIVPFFIYSNFDIEEKQNIEISHNYLQSVLFETLGMVPSEYTSYMSEFRKIIPVISSHYYIAEDGNTYMLDDETSPYYEKLKEYEKMVYYQMFDNT